ncbi:MAG TPA: hypothetical protein VJT75_05670 [Thermoleophilaceae bacterium]|nr:hypothetical protein [Thermoleophilaceae bacterium]
MRCVPAAGRRIAVVVAVLAAVLAAASGADARSRALIGFVPTQPAPKMPLLFDLAERDFSYGVTSPTIGAFAKRQMLLDMSQGSRIANHAYGDPLKRLDLRLLNGGDGRIKGFRLARRRALDAPGDVIPGLFGSTLQRAGRKVGYVGVSGFQQTEAIVAANRRGHIERVSLGTVGTFARRALRLWERSDVLVARFPSDEAGLAALDGVLAGRRPDDLILIVRAPPAGVLRLLPSGMLGPGASGDVMWSPTTRRLGLVAATDYAPTVLDYLGIDVPEKMQGRVIESRADGDPEEVRARMARLDVVLGRRPLAINTWFLCFCGLALALGLSRGRPGVDSALRIGFLGVLWMPGVALFTAYVLPTRTAELAILALGSLGLGALVDRFVRWPVAPAVPAAFVFAAHAIDLARGSPLIGASLAGPNPKGGARFFGIGNELEILLALEVLLGLGALLSALPRRYTRWGFAIGCLVAAVVIGSGRLGADVGGVITLGAGGAAAFLAALGRPPTRRAVAIAVLVPFAAVLGLVALDLLTAGGAHLTRSVVHGGGPADLFDIVKRRLIISVNGLASVTTAITVVLGMVAFYFGVKRRHEVFAALRDEPAFMAGIWGAFAATVVGALANDSGPLIFEAGLFLLLLATGYARARPGAGNGERPRAIRRAEKSRVAADPVG